MPDPGSVEARQLGCICPKPDNARPAGYMGTFWLTAGCVVHAPRPPPGRFTCGWKSTHETCRNCKMSGKVEVGQQWRCSNCITAWWIDGPYG